LPICHLTLGALKPKQLGYPTAPKTLGEHLRKRRIDLGLIQRELSAKIGADEASVWLWENNRVSPELKWMPAILAFLGHDPRPAADSIGGQLVRLRKGRGWSQKRLAAELKVDPTTLSRWELEKRIPSGVYGVRVRRLIE
jgi:transcriptional regulator with XRE-family HTH domain